MSKGMTEQNTTTGFIEKYKKWIVALAAWQVIPVILLISAVIGSTIYHYINDDTHFHPYKSYIVSGFESGFRDGQRDSYNSGRDKIIPSSVWSKYNSETGKMKKKLLQEKEEYLAQFPESERSAKRAEMKLNNIKLPLEKEIRKRFTVGLNFTANYVDQKIKRENYSSDKEYHNALDDEAWKVGYAEGYRKGMYGYGLTNDALNSFRH